MSAKALAVGDEAPNFDLTSTEGVVLMLRDEVPRTAVLLYFFADVGADQARRDLRELAAQHPDLAALRVAVLGVSPSKLDGLKRAQSELEVRFPLLHDDRGFSRWYGLDSAGDEGAKSALVLVDRQQRVAWLANPVTSLGAALAEVKQRLRRAPSPTSNYPRAIINRLVDRWVN